MSDRIPFPMPEPQRSVAVRILVEVARKASVPPAYLTAHVQNSIHLGVVYAARREAQQRMLQEVEGMTRAMLARAFRRDVRRMRGSELNETSNAAGSERNDHE